MLLTVLLTIQRIQSTKIQNAATNGQIIVGIINIFTSQSRYTLRALGAIPQMGTPAEPKPDGENSQPTERRETLN